MSVREPDEVGAALDGGAEIVDAKDPARGALGALELGRLVLVLEQVPATAPFSVALGDPRDPVAAVALIDGLHLPPRAAPTYVKLGLAGTESSAAAERVLRAVVRAAGRVPGRPQVIAVAYADAEPGLGPRRVAALARHTGARGVLVDTMNKEGGSLLDWLPPVQLGRWVADAQRLGLLVAVAGGLDHRALELLRASGADVVGVRGAACEGGREGRVSAPKVRRLRQVLAGAGAGMAGAGVAEERGTREAPEPPTRLSRSKASK